MILGIQELEKELQNMSEAELRSGIAKAILPVQEEAKAGCPAHDGELRESIYTDIEERDGKIAGICYTTKKHGPYVEFGTGPKGQESHEGISPEVAVSYTQSPWWIHESQIDRETAEYYHFFAIDTPEGRFYQCVGQAAQPFMYPALKNNESRVVEIVAEQLRRQI